jgi:DNA topoisomerase I
MGEGGSVGLITYMRTDSTNVSEMAQAEARQFIGERYGRRLSAARTARYKPKRAAPRKPTKPSGRPP